MVAHSAFVFVLSVGAVSVGKIVKSAAPAFAAAFSQFVYDKPLSKVKLHVLPIVFCGITLASVKELDFTMSVLVSAYTASLFAAFKENTNKKLMMTTGLNDRLGSVSNRFPVTTIREEA